MSINKTNEIGNISIDKDVIAGIAANAAMECYGVVGLTYKNATSGLVKLLKGEQLSKGVEIRELEDGIYLDLFVMIQFGTKISVVAENILEKVKYNVETQTGITIKEVNLNIEGVKVRD